MKLEQIRDELIAELESPKHSAAKFEPALKDWFAQRQVNPETANQQNLDTAKNDVRALVSAAHQRAVQNLAQELTKPEYQGMSAQEIYDSKVLVTDAPIMADVPARTEMEELIETFRQNLSGYAGSTNGVIIVKDQGKLLDASPELQALFDEKVAHSGKPLDELNIPRTKRVEIGKSPNAVGRIWSGIPYTYNEPPVEVIEQALNLN